MILRLFILFLIVHVSISIQAQCPEVDYLDGLVLTKILTHEQFKDIGLEWNKEGVKLSEEDVLKIALGKEKAIKEINSKEQLEKHWATLNQYWENQKVTHLIDSDTCTSIRSKIKQNSSDFNNYELRAIYTFENHYLVALKSKTPRLGITPAFILDESRFIVKRFGI